MRSRNICVTAMSITMLLCNTSCGSPATPAAISPKTAATPSTAPALALAPTPTIIPTAIPTVSPTAAPTAPPTVAPTHPPDYWPTQAWRTSTPEEQGMDSAGLTKMFDYMSKTQADYDSLLIIRNGYIVLDVYRNQYGPDKPHAMNWDTMSFVSTLAGIAIADGRIKSIDQKLVEFFPGRNIANLDAKKQSVTLEHLLTMTSGYKWLNWDLDGPRGIAAEKKKTLDWLQFALDQPMLDEPGTHYEYALGNAHVLAGVVSSATGADLLAYAQKNLFDPLGIRNAGWEQDPQGLRLGWTGLTLTPHDLAKYGLLLLKQGRWEGRQVVPAEWVARATGQVKAGPAAAQKEQYGYHWWYHTEAGHYGFMAYGGWGQAIAVYPDDNLVLVMTQDRRGRGEGEDEATDDLILFHLAQFFILPAVKANAPLAPNPAAVELLMTQVKKAGQ